MGMARPAKGGMNVERLTKHVKNEKENYVCLQDCEKECVHGWLKGEEGCRCEKFGELLVRLAQIENILGDTYDLDRMRELVEADKAGRCVVLPCKLHDKVFFIENGGVKETEVDSFHNWTSGRWELSAHTDRMFDHWKGYEIDFSGIGKTVFLTREAAESVLAKEADHE